VRRPGSDRRASAVAAVASLVLFALLGVAPNASAEPPRQGPWLYEFTDFTAMPAATDYDHRAVTLTGLLLRHLYGGLLSEPAAGETVDLTQSPGDTASGASGGAPAGGSMGTATTDAQGRFWLENAVVDPRAARTGAPAAGPHPVVVQAVHHSAGDASSVGSGDAEARLEVTATPSTARLTVAYQVGAVSAAGRTVTAQGGLQRDSGQGPQPVADASVRVEYRTAGAPPLVKTAGTGSDGRFSVAFTATANGTVTASVDPSADPYLDLTGPDGVSRPIAVPAPTPSATPSPTVTAVRPLLPAAHRVVGTRAPSRSPAPHSAPPAAAPKSVQPADEPPTLAVTGDGTPRIAFLTGGSTLLTAGLLVMVVRRRMRVAG
jgi:hypothetical protein